MSERPSEMVAVVGTSDPANQTAGTFTTDVIDASLYDSILFIWQTGSVCSCSGKIVFKMLEGTATSTVTTVVGSTTWSASSTGDINLQHLLDLDCADLSGPTYRYVKSTAKYSGGTGCLLSCVALGFKPRFHPASDGDLASVDVIKVST